MASAPDEAPTPSSVLRGHATEVTAARFAAGAAWHDSAGLPHLLSASADGEVRVWSLQTCRSVAVLPEAHADKSVLAVRALVDSRVLSHGRDGFVRVWDLADGNFRGPAFTLPSASYNFCQCACSAALTSRPMPTDADGSDGASGGGAPLLAMPNEDANKLHLWDVRQPHAPARVLSPSDALGKTGMCMCVHFCRSDTLLLSGWEDGSLHTFDLRGGGGGDTAAASAAAHLPPSSLRLHKEPLLCVDVSPSEEYALTGAADTQMHVVPLAADGAVGAPTASLKVPVTNEASGSGGLAALSVRPDGRVLAAGGWDKRVRLWQWKRWKPLAVLRHHTATVNAVSFSDDSRWLASASSDRTIALWTLFPPKER